MIERIIVNGEKLETKIGETFNEKIEPVVEDNRAKIRRLENRVEDLERTIMEMDAWKAKFEAEMYEKLVSR